MTRQLTTQRAQQDQSGGSHLKGGTLQRKCASCGNHTLSGDECSECRKKKWKGVQTKLKIGDPDDAYEREADRIADQVMAMPTPVKPNKTPIKVQRFSGHASGEAAEAPPSVERVLSSPGRPLPPDLAEDMGNRFGYDFSEVRIHSDTAAARSAIDVNAYAYTVGNHIVFDTARSPLRITDHQRLLTHELTHVIQQSRNNTVSVQRQGRNYPSFSQDALHVKFWINAFIPGDAEGAIEVPAGPYRGMTMLPGPIPWISDCFLTDNRGFSLNPRASSRMHGIYEFTYHPGRFVDGVQSKWSDPTHELDCEDGEVECNKRGIMPDRVFSIVQFYNGSPERAFFNFNASASNPCFFGAPAIDYYGRVNLDLRSRNISYRIVLDGYPAYEAYIEVNNSAPISLMQEYPPTGNSPGNLFGPANRIITGIESW